MSAGYKGFLCGVGFEWIKMIAVGCDCVKATGVLISRCHQSGGMRGLKHPTPVYAFVSIPPPRTPRKKGTRRKQGRATETLHNSPFVIPSSIHFGAGDTGIFSPR